MLLPKKDVPVAHRHAETSLSFGVHTVSPSVENPAENWFSDGIHPTFVGCQDLSTLDECGINPIRFCAEMGIF